jgi:predicted DCC family thiol-disulfide oxidoreductase YuxK
MSNAPTSETEPSATPFEATDPASGPATSGNIVPKWTYAARGHRDELPTLHLTVLYDSHCVLCQRCRAWLEHQPTYVTLEFMAADSDAAVARFGTLPWLGEELIVVNEWGQAWIGPAGFIMCLWATKRYREWGDRLSSNTWSGMAEQFFHLVTSQRSKLAKILRPNERQQCDSDTCRKPGHAKPIVAGFNAPNGPTSSGTVRITGSGYIPGVGYIGPERGTSANGGRPTFVIEDPQARTYPR